MIRSDEQTSRRAKVKSGASVGVVVCVEGEPVKARTLVIGRLTMGRCEVGVRGLGISGCISVGASRAARRQRRHSTVEVGESRWREGRQEIGVSGNARPQVTRSKCQQWLRRRKKSILRDPRKRPSGQAASGVPPQTRSARRACVSTSSFNRRGSDLAGSRSHRSSSSPPGAGDWRAVCGKTACTVRREGRPERAVSTPIQDLLLPLAQGGTIRWVQRLKSPPKLW